MRAVQAVTNWDGTLSNYLKLTLIADDLSSYAIFNAELFKADLDENNVIINTVKTYEKRLDMTGEEYTLWGQSANINNEAYVWACSPSQLNLTLL